MEKNKLLPGFYVGIRRATRNFCFSVPKIGQGVTDSDMDKWFQSLNSGSRSNRSDNHTNNPAAERSTSFSGWYKTDNAINLSNKCLLAPSIYRAAGGDDPDVAQTKVSSFKKKAAEVLSRCADSGEAITEAIASEINVNSCVVHEIKVIVLCVKDTQFPGSRHNEDTHMWYKEKVVRKFYLSLGPDDRLLSAFAQEIADPTTGVNAERKLVAVRSDRVTPIGNRVSSFTIRSVTDEEAVKTDQKLMAAVNRIKRKQAEASIFHELN